ncbi:MAG: cation:proton antiporter [Leptospiraceae bacterium]|nr:cation:proton antiporter [Leptospiraceae bacterium]MDW8306430.1 cation:proton antiporter [Leptospiraceae bacterium]
MPLQLSEQLGIILLCATLFALMGNLLHVPPLVVYLFTGLFLGPIAKIVFPLPLFEMISETGITLLLFLVGLEIHFSKMKDIGRDVLFAGMAQIILTALLGFLLARILGYTWFNSLYLAIALTFSSTVVVVKLLDEKGHLGRLYGRLSVGIFLVQDLVAILLLTLVAALPRQGEVQLAKLLWQIGQSFVSLGGLLIAVIFLGRYALPSVFHWGSRSMDTLVIWSLALCFGISLLAEKLGLSMEIGSFTTGLALAQHPWAKDLRRRVHPLMNFFIMVFFVLLGVQMDLASALRQIDQALLLSIVVLLGKPLVFYLILQKMHHSQQTSFLTGITVAQISEFSFIFVALGISLGIASQELMALVSLIGILTISLSAYMILHGEKLFELWKKVKTRGIDSLSQDKFLESHAPWENHIVVVGMNELGTAICKKLLKFKEKVIAIDMNPHRLQNLKTATVLGNIEHPSTIEESYFRQAKLVISALSSEETNNFLAFLCQRYHIPFVAHARDPSMKDGLMATNTRYIISPKEDVIEHFRQIVKSQK